jgi:hypothetical protein
MKKTLSPGNETLLNGLDTNEMKRLRRKRVGQIRSAVFQEQAQRKQMLELQSQFSPQPDDDFSSSSGSSDLSTLPGSLADILVEPKKGGLSIDISDAQLIKDLLDDVASPSSWPLYSPTAVSNQKRIHQIQPAFKVKHITHRLPDHVMIANSQM